MQSLYFWKTWLKEYRYTWYTLALLLTFSVALFWFFHAKGVSNIVHWDKVQEQRVVETTVHSFRVGPFVLDVSAESYVNFEYFNGSGVEPNTLSSYIFLALLIVSAVVLISFITTLEGFWFYGGMVLVIFFLTGLRFEVVGLFGLYDRIPLAVIVLVTAGLGYYFNHFRSWTPFLVRVLFFAIIALAIGLCIALFSHAPNPLYYLTITAYIPGLILALLFTFMVAHEIFASFVAIVDESTTSSLRHYSIISFLYFLYLLITALHELGVIEWDFIYINAYLLLTISTILGIWGFRQREPVYGKIFSFYPFGAFFYLGMAIICFATMSTLAGSANDPAMRIVRHVIIFSHLGYGLIFLTYVISNFILMMARNIGVYKVLYQPNRMPYFTYRFAGTIAMLAFVFVAGWKEYVSNGMAAFYNFTAGLHALEGDRTYSQAFYDQASHHGFQNHHAHYALGTIHASQLDFEKAHNDYRHANAQMPSAYSLINAGNISIWEGNPSDAIETYSEAISIIPGSGPLNNNLGFAFAKVNSLDSTLHYLNAARRDKVARTSAETNFFALAATKFLPFKSDSILVSFNTDAPGTTANAIALASLFQQSFQAPVDPLKSQKLNLHAATLLNNYMIYHAHDLDTAFTNKAWKIASDEANAEFREALKASLAYAYYHQGNVSKALEILAEQVYLSQSHQGKYNYVMGLWALEQGNPELASRYFSFAGAFDYKSARFYNAIALTEARMVNEALMAWDSVAKYQPESEKLIAERMKTILTIPADRVTSLTDPEKYQFCRYRLPLNDSVMFERIANAFDNANYKAQALLDMSRRHFGAGNTVRAIRYYQRIAGLELTDTTLYNDARHFELQMLASRKELTALATQINKGITFGQDRFIEKVLYTALLSESDTAKARKHYEILSRYNPYFEEGILAAAEYFANDKDTFKSYKILSEAIQVNNTSRRLLEAYIKEAALKGFDSYVATAMEQLEHIRGRE